MNVPFESFNNSYHVPENNLSVVVLCETFKA